MALRNGMPDQVLGELYPFEDKYVELSDGRTMHYIEMGRAGLRRPTFLLLHGQPTWSFLYREFMEPLSQVGRVIAVDHMGFGRSDHPSDPDYYTLDQHISNLEEFVARKKLKRVIPVMQDWGGPIGAGYATRHPDNIAGMVILNTWAFTHRVDLKIPWWFRAVRKGRTAKYMFGKRNMFVERFIPTYTKRELTDAEMEAYRHPFPNEKSRAGIVAFPGMIPDKPGHPEWHTMDHIDRALPAISAPALILWATGDPAFGKRVAWAWKEALPRAEDPVWLDAGHYLQEDVPEEIVERILAWVKST